MKLGKKSAQSTWLQIYGVSLLCGVGFTMSLFIGILAFPGAIDAPEQVEVKLGVILGSTLSASLGAVILAVAARRRRNSKARPSTNTDPDAPLLT